MNATYHKLRFGDFRVENGRVTDITTIAERPHEVDSIVQEVADLVGRPLAEISRRYPDRKNPNYISGTRVKIRDDATITRTVEEMLAERDSKHREMVERANPPKPVKPAPPPRVTRTKKAGKAEWIAQTYAPALDQNVVSVLARDGEVLATITMDGASYTAHVLGRRDGGYRTETQAKNAAKRALRARKIID